MFAKGIDAFIEQYQKENNYSGILRITLKDEVIYEKFIGLADEQRGIPFSKDSMFTFYSLSKPFCALGLLKLCDKGLVSLDDHPARYVKEATGFDKRVTIRQMLNHTSGLPDCYLIEEFRTAHRGLAKDARRYVEMIAGYPQYFQPGTDAKYSNINFTLSALIIENVTGMSYSEYMKNEVFLPLGMKTALVDEAELYVKNRVQGYELSGDKKLPVDRSVQWMLGGGDIIGTVDDVYRLNPAIKNRLLLKSETWDEVLTPSPYNQMGFGCTVKTINGRLRITHNGAHTGFRTYHIQLPKDDLDIILLSNCGWGNARKDFEAEIYKLYYGDTEVIDNTQMDAGYAK